MRDIFTEDIIKKERNDGNLVLIVLCVISAVVAFVLDIINLIFGGFIMCAVFGYLAFNFASKHHVEYEVEMTNEMVQVDAIYNRQQRKTLLEINLQDAKAVAPTNALRLEGLRKSGMKTISFTSGVADRKTYSIIGEFSGIPMEIIIEPTEKILEHLRFICKNTFYEE